METVSAIKPSDMAAIIRDHAADHWAQVDAAPDDLAAYRAAKACPPLLFEGHPGIAKSAGAEDCFDDIADVRLTIRLGDQEPTDLIGWRVPSDDNGGIMRLYRPDWIPTDDSVRVGLIVDELGQCSQAVQSVAMQMLRDRKLGTTRFGNRVVMIALANRASDKAGSSRLHTALASRFSRFTVEPDWTDYLDWAARNGIDPSIRSAIRWDPTLFDTFDPARPDEPFACARTWEYASTRLRALKNPAHQYSALCGLLGPDVAGKFWTHRRVYSGLPNGAEVLSNPTGVDCPTDAEPGACYAMACIVADAVRALPANSPLVDSAFVYADRLPREEYTIFVGIQVLSATDGAAAVSTRGREFMAKYRDTINAAASGGAA